MGSWNVNRKTKVYLLIAFSWTWFGWITAYLMSRFNGDVLSVDSTIFSLWTDTWGSDRFLPQIIFAVAVYGPLVGFLATVGFKRLFKNGEGTKQLWHYVFLIPLVSVIPSIVLSSFTSYYNPAGVSIVGILVAVLLYFLSNLVTSGTEEFGWRGVLYPEMKSSGMSFWDIAWKGGIIWALWHYPLLFIMYMPLGVIVLIPSLVGFTASIVAMNYITNFLYEEMQNIWAVVVLHALNNTMSFVVVLLFPGTPFLILSSLMAWVIVGWIEKKHVNVVG